MGKALIEADRVEVSLWLDSYDEIFSDFDPRPYTQRTVSDDFIAQARLIMKDVGKQAIRLNLQLDEMLRNADKEKAITERLHSYFQKTGHYYLSERNRLYRKGATFISLGLLALIIASFISFNDPQRYYLHVLLVLFEPAGWFLLWTGLDHFVFHTMRTKKEHTFYAKMSEAVIEFGSRGNAE